MNDLQVFSNPEFGEVRTVEIDGEAWFVGKDISDILGYAKSRNALAAHVYLEDKKEALIEGALGGPQKMTVINESGLYSLVLSSKLPNARKFKKWVTSEVLPSIRKTGVYAAPNVDSKMMRQIADAMEAAEKRVEELSAENERQKLIIADYEPKVDYLSKILASDTTLATSQIAADYGMSAIKLNAILHDAGVQRRVNGQWILYRSYMGKGPTKSSTFHFTRADGTPDCKMTTNWTQRGRLLIHRILEDNGYTAVMDKAEGV